MFITAEEIVDYLRRPDDDADGSRHVPEMPNALFSRRQRTGIDRRRNTRQRELSIRRKCTRPHDGTGDRRCDLTTIDALSDRRQPTQPGDEPPLRRQRRQDSRFSWTGHSFWYADPTKDRLCWKRQVNSDDGSDGIRLQASGFHDRPRCSSAIVRPRRPLQRQRSQAQKRYGTNRRAAQGELRGHVGRRRQQHDAEVAPVLELRALGGRDASHEELRINESAAKGEGETSDIPSGTTTSRRAKKVAARMKADTHRETTTTTRAGLVELGPGRLGQARHLGDTPGLAVLHMDDGRDISLEVGIAN